MKLDTYKRLYGKKLTVEVSTNTALGRLPTNFSCTCVHFKSMGNYLLLETVLVVQDIKLLGVDKKYSNLQNDATLFAGLNKYRTMSFNKKTKPQFYTYLKHVKVTAINDTKIKHLFGADLSAWPNTALLLYFMSYMSKKAGTNSSLITELRNTYRTNDPATTLAMLRKLRELPSPKTQSISKNYIENKGIRDNLSLIFKI